MQLFSRQGRIWVETECTQEQDLPIFEEIPNMTVKHFSLKLFTLPLCLRLFSSGHATLYTSWQYLESKQAFKYLPGYLCRLVRLVR